MITYYLAGRYSRKIEFAEIAKKIEDTLGYCCSSSWLTELEKPDSTLDQVASDRLTFYALRDLHDILQADFTLFFAEDPLIGTPRGGRHVEFGYALAQKKPIVIIGPKENIFHYLPADFDITHYNTVEAFIAAETAEEDNANAAST